MRKIVISCALLSVMGLMSCSSNKSEQAADSAIETDSIVTVDSTPVADTAIVAEETPAEEVNTDEADMKMIKEFYTKYALTRQATKSQLQKYCTAACLKKLAAANEYDDGGYALWDMTTGAQDGDGATRVNSVEPKGDGWFRVSYIEMGIKGVTDVQVVDGKINNYRQVR